jgi:hypothetical protein
LAVGQESQNNVLPSIDEQVLAVAKLVTFVVSFFREKQPVWWPEATADNPQLSWNAYKSLATWHKEIKKAFLHHIHSKLLEEPARRPWRPRLKDPTAYGCKG